MSFAVCCFQGRGGCGCLSRASATGDAGFGLDVVPSCGTCSAAGEAGPGAADVAADGLPAAGLGVSVTTTTGGV
jgi:hypothetical protein